MFGDDDDLWHPRRVATFIDTMRAHPLLECVGVFATFARANVEAGELDAGASLPTDWREVDDFLRDGRATLNHEEEDSSAWLQEWSAAGADRAALMMPDGLNLEYFDFCPRLRVVREFFGSVAPPLLRHRFCDLCFAEFLMRYGLRGAELGLELSHVESETWLYFYAHRGLREEEWDEACEGWGEEPCRPRPVGVADGHVSSSVSVDTAEVHLAMNRWEDFLSHDEAITPSKLSRYVAHFRNSIEMMMMRFHRQKIDQRDFSRLVIEASRLSFVGFIATFNAVCNMAAENLMLEVCSGIAKTVASRLEVSVLWRDRYSFVSPGQEPEESASGLSSESSESEPQGCPGGRPGGARPAGGRASGARRSAPAEGRGGRGAGEEALGVQAGEARAGDARAVIAGLPQKALSKWERSVSANHTIRTFTVEAEWGEAKGMGFEDAIRLLDYFGVTALAIVRHLGDEGIREEAFMNECDVRTAAVDVLRWLFPEAERAGYLPFLSIYKLFQVFGVTVQQFLKAWQEGHGDNVDFSAWPLLKGFRVLHEIGEGMRGSVFLCEDARTARLAALKWPVNVRELEIMNTFQEQLGDSSGLPRILASGWHLDEAYVVTQLLGSDLQKVFGHLGAQPLERRWAIVSSLGRSLLRRLQAVHGCGFVHCDVSPENVVLGRSRETRGIVPYLIDFGCAREFPGGGPVSGDHGSMEFSSVRSGETCERSPEDDLEALGWAMVNGVAGDLPWFAGLAEYYALKPALQKVKREGVVASVREAKASLLSKGWHSLGPEWGNLYEVPPQLDGYLRTCQAPGGSGRRPDYQQLARLLGAQGDWGTAKAEIRDSEELQALLSPVFGNT